VRCVLLDPFPLVHTWFLLRFLAHEGFVAVSAREKKLHTAYVGCKFEALEMTPSFAASWKSHKNGVRNLKPDFPFLFVYKIPQQIRTITRHVTVRLPSLYFFFGCQGDLSSASLLCAPTTVLIGCTVGLIYDRP